MCNVKVKKGASGLSRRAPLIDRLGLYFTSTFTPLRMYMPLPNVFRLLSVAPVLSKRPSML